MMLSLLLYDLLVVILSPLREHLHAHKIVPYLSNSFLYFINFIHKFHMQSKNLYNRKGG